MSTNATKLEAPPHQKKKQKSVQKGLESSVHAVDII